MIDADTGRRDGHDWRERAEEAVRTQLQHGAVVGGDGQTAGGRQHRQADRAVPQKPAAERTQQNTA